MNREITPVSIEFDRSSFNWGQQIDADGLRSSPAILIRVVPVMSNAIAFTGQEQPMDQHVYLYGPILGYIINQFGSCVQKKQNDDLAI